MVNDRVQFVDCVLVLVSVVSGSVSHKVWIGSSVTPHVGYTRNPYVSPALFILTPPPLMVVLLNTGGIKDLIKPIISH